MLLLSLWGPDSISSSCSLASFFYCSFSKNIDLCTCLCMCVDTYTCLLFTYVYFLNTFFMLKIIPLVPQHLAQTSLKLINLGQRKKFFQESPLFES